MPWSLSSCNKFACAKHSLFHWGSVCKILAGWKRSAVRKKLPTLRQRWLCKKGEWRQKPLSSPYFLSLTVLSTGYSTACTYKITIDSYFGLLSVVVLKGCSENRKGTVNISWFALYAGAASHVFNHRLSAAHIQIAAFMIFHCWW